MQDDDGNGGDDYSAGAGGGGDGDYGGEEEEEDVDVQAWTSGVANSLASLWSEYSRDITEFATGVQSETSNLVQTAVDAAPEVASTAQDKFGMVTSGGRRRRRRSLIAAHHSCTMSCR